MTLRLALVLAVAACGPETTSFRTTDRGDLSEHPGPAAAAYELGGARVHVWSNGGYVSPTDEPMTHVGFEIVGGAQPAVFDAESLRLVALDKHGMVIDTAFVAVTPLGPARVPVAAGAVVPLDAYFKLGVRPRVVQAMRVQWTLKVGDRGYGQTTTFTRDDDFPVADPPARATESSGARI